MAELAIKNLFKNLKTEKPLDFGVSDIALPDGWKVIEKMQKVIVNRINNETTNIVDNVEVNGDKAV